MFIPHTVFSPLMSILVRNARYAITMDSSRRIISNASIAIEGSSVAAVGKTEDVLKQYPSAEHVIDASHCVVTPGLIDCHLHTAQYLGRGIADNVSLPTWIHDRVYPYEAELRPEECRIAATACLIEAVKTGTTFIADPGSYHMNEIVEAVGKVGIRAVLARSLVDINTPGRPIPKAMSESTEKAVREGEEFVRRHNKTQDGRIRAWFCIRTERTTSNELASAIKEKADRYGTGIESHVANAQDSVNRHKEIFRKTPLQRYHDIGILGPNLLIIHANWLTDQEVDLVKKYDVKVAHCPTSNLTTGSGTLVAGKFEKMEEMGITVALGADSAAASNFLDMIRVGYTTIAHRDVRTDPTLYPPEHIMEMLTLNGARALLSEKETGSIEVGKKADIVVFDTKKPGWTPLLNPVSNLIQSASGQSARDVIIDGKLVVRDGRVQNVDEEEIRTRAEQVAEEVTQRAGVRGHGLSTWPIV